MGIISSFGHSFRFWGPVDRKESREGSEDHERCALEVSRKGRRLCNECANVFPFYIFDGVFYIFGPPISPAIVYVRMVAISASHATSQKVIREED